jgi:hypothetical protein
LSGKLYFKKMVLMTQACPLNARDKKNVVLKFFQNEVAASK